MDCSTTRVVRNDAHFMTQTQEGRDLIDDKGFTWCGELARHDDDLHAFKRSVLQRVIKIIDVYPPSYNGQEWTQRHHLIPEMQGLTCCFS